MRILVTGAGGQLGRGVVRAAQRAGHHVDGRDHAQLDIADADAIRRTIASERPEAIVNCAAYTDVDGAEGDLESAMVINAHAPGHLAAASAEADVLLVHLSTDYVFDGARAEPYVEADEPSPRSAYGRSKLAGEQAIARTGARHAIVRTSWLFGSGGRNFVETMLRLADERGEVAVVTDQVGCPTWTGHLAEALVDIAQRSSLGLHHVAAAGECSWHDFAVEIFRQAAVRCTVLEQASADLDRPAPRPTYSVLRSQRSDAPRLAPWTEGLAAYLSERHAGDPAPAASTASTA